MAAQIAIMYDASGDDDSIDITIGTSRDNDTGNDIGLATNAVKLMMICTKKQLLPRMLASETVNREWHPSDIAVSGRLCRQCQTATKNGNPPSVVDRLARVPDI